MTGRQKLGAVTVVLAAAIVGLVPLLLGADVAGRFPELIAAWRGGGLQVSLLAFVATVAIGELVPLPQPEGGALPLSVAVIATHAVLVADPLSTVGVAFLGAATAYVVARSRHESEPGAIEVLAATLGGWMAGGAAAMGAMAQAWLWRPPAAETVAIGSMIAVALAVIFGTPLWDAMTRPDDRPSGSRYVDRLRSGWLSGAALASAALLGALVYPTLGLIALPLVLLPLLAARAGLQKYAVVRETDDQTVRAFSRLPEELGTVPPGHGIRVADIAPVSYTHLTLPTTPYV